jgi:serine-type D-Ala-D-Ala carboxypeptidase (penicillin-binding protein 5/6)
VGAVSLINTNKLLGVNGIEGIKTGYTEEAGACLLLSKKMIILGKERIVTSVVLGAQTREDAYRISEEVLNKAGQYVQQSSIGLAGRVAGEITTAWGSRSDIVLANNLDADTVLGTVTVAKPMVKNNNPHTESEEVGVMKVRGSETKLVLKTELAAPSVYWRLTHPR